MGVSIVGSISSWIEGAGLPAVIAIGRNDARASVAQRSVGKTFIRVLHPTAHIAKEANIGIGSVVFAGAIVQPDATIGKHVIINTGASVDHDCDIGDFAHIAPGACLAGGVTVGEGTLIGIGAIVIPGIRIGKWVTVGAGAAVIRDVADGLTVAGVPAKPLVGKRT